MGVKLNATGVDWRAFHETINQQVPIVEVLALLGVDVSRVGRKNVHVICPVHTEKKPSLFVHLNDAHANSAFCFGSCRHWYGPITLWAAVRGMSYIDAADQLAEMYGIKPGDAGPSQHPARSAEPKIETEIKWPEPMTHDEVVFYHAELSQDDYDFLDRVWALDRPAVDWFKIGHKLDWPPAWVIPVWGERVGGDLYSIRFRRDDVSRHEFKDRVSPEQWAWLDDTIYWGLKDRNGLYPLGLWSLVVNWDYVLVVESEKTAYAVSQHGVPCVTLTGGVGGHPNGWKSWVKYLDGFRYWLTIFDDDEAGQRAALGMRMNWPNKVVPFVWPETWHGLDLVEVQAKLGFETVFDRVEDLMDVTRKLSAEKVDLSQITYWLGFGGKTRKLMSRGWLG